MTHETTVQADSDTNIDGTYAFEDLEHRVRVFREAWEIIDNELSEAGTHESFKTAFATFAFEYLAMKGVSLREQLFGPETEASS